MVQSSSEGKLNVDVSVLETIELWWWWWWWWWGGGGGGAQAERNKRVKRK